MQPILQQRLPVAPWMKPHTLRLPGTQPVPIEAWLERDEVFAEQMALRDRLLAERPGDVLAEPREAAAAADELLSVVLERLAADPGYRREPAALVRPDGVAVPLGGPPLATLGRLIQEDLLLLDRGPNEAEHRLVAGILCFPSNWTLAQKLGRGLERIHLPVDVYDAAVARRVQRLFDGIRPLEPLMRTNLLLYGTSDLFNPRLEFDRHQPDSSGARFVRVERQCLVRLPRTRAVVFSIHTYMVRPEALSEEQRAALLAHRPGAFSGG